MNDGGAGGKAAIRSVAALAIALAVWGGYRLVGASEPHRLPPPTPALAVEDERNAFACGLTPADLRRFLADGAPTGVAPGGATVSLTLDPRLQREIFDLFRRYDPPYGVFAAMEPKTGRVLALVGYRKGGEPDPLLPLKAVYPAASLIKVITAAAALETGGISPEEEISYRGGIYRITRRGLHARGGRGVPTMTLEEAIARSANSVFGKVTVDYVGSETLGEFLERFGFGQSIPFGLPVEVSHGEIPSDELHLARTGAGFGDVYVSPLHMAMIMSAIACSGEMPRPFLIDSVRDGDGRILYAGAPAKWRDTVSPGTADTLLRMMVKTIENGTSQKAFGTPESTPLLRDIQVAGKTGSLSGWSPRMRFEWFAGAAPVGDAQLAVAALVVNDDHWRIKGSYVGREAFSSYFGYPQSKPPASVKRRAGKKGRRVDAGTRGTGKAGRTARLGKKSRRPAPGATRGSGGRLPPGVSSPSRVRSYRGPRAADPSRG